MTFVSNSFADYAQKINKLYTIEVHTFSGEVEIVEIYAKSAEIAQNEAASQVGEVDYTIVLFAEIA